MIRPQSLRNGWRLASFTTPRHTLKARASLIALKERPEILLANVFPALSRDGTALEGLFVSFWGIPKTLRDHRVRHNIEFMFRYARRFFSLTPADPRFPELVRWLAEYHLDHSFRYRKTGPRSLPLASEAAEIIDATVDGVEPYVRDQFLKLRSGTAK